MIVIRFLKLWLTGALCIGAGCSIFFYLAFMADFVRPDVRILDAWIPVVVIIFMLIYIRSFRAPTEPFHFWEGLVLGNLMLWAGGLFSGLLIWLFSQADPEPFRHYIQSSIRYLEIYQQQAPDNQKLTNTKQIISEWRSARPDSLIWDETKRKIQYSLLLVPLISVFIRRK